MRARLAVLILAVAALAARPADPLATARRLYNSGQFDQALAAAQQAETIPATASSARLVIGRIRLERYRQTAQASDLDGARAALRAVDAGPLAPRERLELQVGVAELMYFDDQFGAAAEMLEPVLDASSILGPDAHERALDWWATALDRQAQVAAGPERAAVYARITDRMARELPRNQASTPANYWMVAAARGAGDLERAQSAAAAAWVRASLAGDRGASLRDDIDRLVTQALIPDRAAKLNVRDRRQTIAGMIAEWEAFKKSW